MRKYLFMALCSALLSPSLVFALDPPAIVEEGTGIMEGGFISPNERLPFLWERFHRGRTGVLITIGALRSFTAAAYGNYHRVDILDHDALTTSFNRLNVELVNRSKGSRRQWLSFLLSAGNIDPKAERYATDVALVESFEVSEALIAKILTLTPQLPQQDRVRILSNKKLLSVQLNKMLQEFRVLSRMPRLWPKLLYGSDLFFQKLYAMTSAGRLFVWNGSLSGSKTLRSLAAYYRRQALNVSAVDLSNVAFQLSKDGELAHLLNNLKFFPVDSSALVFHTTSKSQLIAKGMLSSEISDPFDKDYWLYLVTGWNEFGQTFENKGRPLELAYKALLNDRYPLVTERLAVSKEVAARAEYDFPMAVCDAVDAYSLLH